MNNNWISVKERLPKEAGIYLTTCRMSANDEWFVDDMEYDFRISEDAKKNCKEMIFPNGAAFGELWPVDGNEKELALDNLREVIAWMPIPETYEGEARPRLTKLEETVMMLQVNEVLKRGADYDVKDEVIMNCLEDIAKSLATLVEMKTGDSYLNEYDDEEPKFD